VTPRFIESDDSVRSVDADRRPCKFSDETSSSRIFQKYSYNGCLFECLSKQAIVSQNGNLESPQHWMYMFILKEVCGCSPWKYPLTRSVSDVCDIFGILCFDEIYLNSQRLSNCTCDADCNQIDYDFYIFREEIKPEKVCSSPEYKFLQDYFETFQVRVNSKGFQCWKLINAYDFSLIYNWNLTYLFVTFSRSIKC